MEKKIKNLFFLFSLLLFAGNVHSQPNNMISGIVTDSSGKKALTGVSILIKKLDGSPAVQTQESNSQGHFSFYNLMNGYYNVTITSGGYAKKLFDSVLLNEVKRSIKLDTVKLKQISKLLSGVQVTARQPVISYSADKISFNVAQTSFAAGSNAYELIKSAPEVMQDQHGKMSVRGKTALITVDGKSINLREEDLKSYLSAIQGSSVDKIEVITNPSAKYEGSGSIVINVKTARPANLGTNGNMTIGVGSGKKPRINGGFSLNNRSESSNVYLTLNADEKNEYSINNHVQSITGLPDIIKEKQFGYEHRKNLAMQAGIDHDFNKRSSAGVLIKLNISNRFRDLNNTSHSYSNSLNTPDSSSNVNTSGKTISGSPSINAYYKTRLNQKGSEININADYFVYNKSFKDNYFTNYSYDDINKIKDPDYMRSDAPTKNAVRSFSIDYSSPVKRGKIEVGVKSTYTTTGNNISWNQLTNSNWTVDQSKTNHFVYNENINAAYISIVQKVGSYSITGGLRAEQTNTVGNLVGVQRDKKSYINIFPAFSVMYMKSPRHILMLNYKRSLLRYGFDFVNPFLVYESQYSYTQGNPYLKPQLNNNFTATYVYRQFLSATVTYSNTSRALAAVFKTGVSPNVAVSSYDNLQNQQIWGSSISMSKNIKNKLQVTATSGLKYVEIKNNKNNELSGSNKSVTAFVSLINTAPLTKRINADLTAMYVSPVAVGTIRLNALFTVNAGLSAKVLKDKGQLKLNATDLFNTMRSSFDLNYGAFKSNYYVKQESRFVNLSFIYKFGNNKVKDSKIRRSGVEEEKGRMVQ